MFKKIRVHRLRTRIHNLINTIQSDVETASTAVDEQFKKLFQITAEAEYLNVDEKSMPYYTVLPHTFGLSQIYLFLGRFFGLQWRTFLTQYLKPFLCRIRAKI